MSKSPKEIQKQIERERAETANRNQTLMFIKSMKARQEKSIKKLSHRISNPEIVLDSNDFIEDFCHEVFSLGEQLKVIKKSEAKMMQAIINFGSFDRTSRRTREKILEIAAKIVNKWNS